MINNVKGVYHPWQSRYRKPAGQRGKGDAQTTNTTTIIIVIIHILISITITRIIKIIDKVLVTPTTCMLVGGK